MFSMVTVWTAQIYFYNGFKNHSGLRTPGSLLPGMKVIRNVTVFQVMVPSGTCRYIHIKCVHDMRQKNAIL